MNEFWKTIVWEQFGAAIDMLDNALNVCPDELWQGVVWPDDPGYSDFWYVGYHTLFWLDFYLSRAEEGFTPPPPFGLEEMGGKSAGLTVISIQDPSLFTGH